MTMIAPMNHEGMFVLSMARKGDEGNENDQALSLQDAEKLSLFTKADGVDDFLDEMAQTISRRDQTELAGVPEAISNVKFEVTKFREGYDLDDVDDFLDELSTRIQDLTTASSPVSTAPHEPTGRVSPT